MNQTATDTILLAAVGDIGLIGDVRKNIHRYGPAFVFAGVKDELQRADILFGNLEMPFSETAPDYSEKSSSEFWSDPDTAPALKRGSFSIVSFANNHTLEQGSQGVATTLRLLNRMGIPAVGAGSTLEEARRLVVLTKKNIKVGFLAYAKSDAYATESKPGPAPLDEAIIANDISRSRGRVDILVVSLHFGMIYMDYPSDEGKALCRRIVDMGADVILGHHPHVLQGVEVYNSSIIAYSLGEFIFDPKGGLWYAELGRETRKESMILQIQLSAEGYCGHTFAPVYADEQCRPILATGLRGEAISKRIQRISNKLRNMTSAQFYEYAGKHMVSYELNAFWYHLKRFHLSYFLEKLGKIRTRHLKLLIGFLKKKFSQS